MQMALVACLAALLPHHATGDVPEKRVPDLRLDFGSRAPAARVAAGRCRRRDDGCADETARGDSASAFPRLSALPSVILSLIHI